MVNKIKITLNTDGKNYEKLYLGSKEDPDEAKNAAAIVGTENEDGYTSFLRFLPVNRSRLQHRTIFCEKSEMVHKYGFETERSRNESPGTNSYSRANCSP